MVTENPTTDTQLHQEDIQAGMGRIKRMLLIAGVLAVIGYGLLIIAGVEDAFTIWDWADSTKMWFKLGGVGHMLMGIFIALVAIIFTLKLVPDRLGARLNPTGDGQ